MPEMTEKMWEIAHTLAADLALNRVSKNLVQQTAEYLRSQPKASLSDYLARLERLGDAFAGGKSGRLERADLRRALGRAKWLKDTRSSTLILGWIARLVDYYAEHQAEAAPRSQLQFIELRQGQSLEGTVRERDKRQRQMWVAVAPGQWGAASFRDNVDVGDQVQVIVRRATSPVSFEVEVKISSPVRPAPPPKRSQSQVKPPTSKSKVAPPADSDRISAEAQSFYEFMQKQ